MGATIAGLRGRRYAAPQNEAYELMSKGVIDGSIAPREVLLGWKQAEVVKYVTKCFSIGSFTGMYLVMNNDKWNELPPDIQQIFTDVSAEYVEYWAKVASAYDYDAMVLQRAAGPRGDRPDREESAEWKTAVRPMIDEKTPLSRTRASPTTTKPTSWSGSHTGSRNQVSEEECSAWVKENIKSPSAK